ncbi:MAG: DUF4411 family protein [Nitriliruptor sp.]|uniref:DUF4411 family protein n=1 Tax=Nitriliruptor sp. TaxID=2448056 RepID=UPI00349FD40F
MADTVWILDASSVFRAKIEVPADRQWALFERLKALVLVGRIAVPKQVINEARGQRHTDIPEAWFLGIEPHLQHPVLCSQANLERVMQEVGLELIDVDAETDPADPYVLALALDLQAVALDVEVVTNDRIDRPPRIGLATACERLGVPAIDLDTFLRSVDGW